ncbi:MAG: AAA family ATPase [Oscillospiraceae bacterium]|nr:AAA family ATPase [Oscillospiraceae bacterium]
MRIKEISTEQFAGIRDKKITLNSGMNVIYGKNEAGKSTVVKLLQGVLAREMTRKEKNELEKNAKPAARTDGKLSGSCYDGTVVLEADDGEYALTREWDKSVTSTLRAPTGKFRNTNEINELLSPILQYGDGVYRELFFSPQSSAADNLKSIFDKGDIGTRDALSAAVAKAFSESGGVSADKLGQAIDKKIDELAGKHWDIENMAPERKTGRWAKEVGAVLKAFYDAEDAEKELNDLKQLETDSDLADKRLAEAERVAENAAAALNEFDKYAALIRTRNDIKRYSDDIRKFTAALENYPKAKEALDNAERLKKEKENRALLDCYTAAKRQRGKLLNAEDKLKELPCPSSDEIAALASTEREKQRLENRLRVNFAAKIKMLGGNSVRATSLITGKEIALGDESTPVNEALRIEVPGVMEMELAPVDVDAAKLREDIAALEKTIGDIFDKYGCKAVEEIRRLADQHAQAETELKLAKSAFDSALNGSDFATLEARAAELTDVRGREDIERGVFELCGNNDLSVFIGERRAEIKRFIDDHVGEDELKRRIGELSEKLEQARKTLGSADDIPEKYLMISDTESEKSRLKNALDRANADKEKAIGDKGQARGALDAFLDSRGDDLSEKCERAKRDYNAQVELLNKWLRIRDVFNAQREAVTCRPLDRLVNSFSGYLAKISGNRVTAEFAEADRPDFDIASGVHKLDFPKLSDGTRETVYLAFRLAVLDYLFPEGGVIVLDDPLNDMDTERVRQSCGLIRECSQRHQVIFLTCHEEYAEMLGTDIINI